MLFVDFSITLSHLIHRQSQSVHLYLYPSFIPWQTMFLTLLNLLVWLFNFQILESSQILLTMIKRESSSLDQTLTTGNETKPDCRQWWRFCTLLENYLFKIYNAIMSAGVTRRCNEYKFVNTLCRFVNYKSTQYVLFYTNNALYIIFL